MRSVIVRTGALGDFVATLPVIHRFAEMSDSLIIVASLRYRPLVSVTVPMTWIDADGFEFWGKLTTLTADQGIAWTSAAAQRLRELGVAKVYEGVPKPAPGILIHDHLWAPMAPEWGPRDRDPWLIPDSQRRLQIRQRLNGQKPIVFAPGSGGHPKRWPLHHWRMLAEAIDYPILWVSGPVEAEEQDWGEPRWSDLDLADLAALMAECHSVLAPDSGPAHLAAAVGGVTGVLFVGATDPANWAPPTATIFLSPSLGTLVGWMKNMGIPCHDGLRLAPPSGL